jgi:hypothetical protein
LYGPPTENGRRPLAFVNLLIGTTITHIALRKDVVDFLQLQQTRDPVWMITPTGGRSLRPYLIEFLRFVDTRAQPPESFPFCPIESGHFRVEALDDPRLWSASPRGVSVEPYDNVAGILGWLPEIERITVDAESVELVWNSRM